MHSSSHSTPGLSESHVSNINARVNCISLNHSETLVAAGCSDGKVRTWGLHHAKLKSEAELSGHAKAVEGVCFAGAERPELFGSVSGDGGLFLWSAKNKNEPLKSLQTKSKNSLISFGPGDALVLVCFTAEESSAASRGVAFYATESLDLLFSLALEHRAQSVQWLSPRGEMLLAVASSNHLLLFAIERDASGRFGAGGARKLTLCAPSSLCSIIKTTADQKLLLAGMSDSSVCVYDTSDWICVSTFYPISSPVRHLEVLASEKLVLTFTASPEAVISFYRTGTNAVAWHTDGVVKDSAVGAKTGVLVVSYDGKYSTEKYSPKMSAIFVSSLSKKAGKAAKINGNNKT